MSKSLHNYLFGKLLSELCRRSKPAKTPDSIEHFATNRGKILPVQVRRNFIGVHKTMYAMCGIFL